MKWDQFLHALVRCELKAKYNYLAGWQISAKGALPVLLAGLCRQQLIYSLVPVMCRVSENRSAFALSIRMFNCSRQMMPMLGEPDKFSAASALGAWSANKSNSFARSL